jgi:hypothetical protein
MGGGVFNKRRQQGQWQRGWRASNSYEGNGDGDGDGNGNSNGNDLGNGNGNEAGG